MVRIYVYDQNFSKIICLAVDAGSDKAYLRFRKCSEPIPNLWKTKTDAFDWSLPGSSFKIAHLLRILFIKWILQNHDSKSV